MMNTLLQHYDLAKQIVTLPVASLRFERRIEPEHITATYRYYTKRHPRYKIIRHKTLGAALIDLKQVNTCEKYYDLIKGKNCGAYHAKRARSRGYVFSEIDRNQHVDAIHFINTSCASRQGRPMDTAYQQKKEFFEALPHFRYYGVLDAQGRLVAYGNLGRYGNFCGFTQLIGIRNNDGIMHLLMVEIVSRLIDQGLVRYVMYDTFFGAQQGMRQFKTVLGFRPYRAKYQLL